MRGLISFGARVVEPETFDDAGAEVLDEHVGLADRALSTAAMSAGFLKSAAKLSLPRLMAWNRVESPPISVSVR